jgi:hypothetical protein
MATEAVEEEESILPYRSLSGTLEIDRDTLLNMLSGIVKTQHFKITKGRIRDAKNEKLRLENVRVLAYLASVYNGILKDRDLTDIEKRLEALENAKPKP